MEKTIEIKNKSGEVIFSHTSFENRVKYTMEEAVKRGISLVGADLRRSDLRGIDLSGADLRDANLSGANLRGANLRGALFYNKNLDEANTEGIIFEEKEGFRITVSCDPYNSRYHYHGEPVVEYDGRTPVKWVKEDDLTEEEALEELEKIASQVQTWMFYNDEVIQEFFGDETPEWYKGEGYYEDEVPMYLIGEDSFRHDVLYYQICEK